MKNIFYTSIFFIITLLSSCNKDLGHYDYVEADSLLVGNLEESMSIPLGGRLQFKPELSSTVLPVDERQLSFEWVVFDNSNPDATQRRKIISKERNLDTVPKLAVGSYPAYFTVRNKLTQNIWNYRFTLNVTGAFGKYGFFVLSDQDGHAHLDFFQDNPEQWNTYPIINRDFNRLLPNEIDGKTLELVGKPKSLASVSNQDLVMKSAKNYLYINTDNHTYKINVSDGMLYNTTSYNFINETAAGLPSSADRIFGVSAGQSFAMKDNNIYSLYYIMQKYYNVPINSYPTGGTYKISEMVAMPMGNSGGNMMVFNMDKRSLMKLNLQSANAIPLTSEGSGVDVSNLQKDLVWLGQTSAFGGQALAILKDNVSYYLLRMTFTESAGFAVNSITDVTDTFTDIAQAKHFAVDNLFGYIFYATDDKIYQYDMDSKVFKLAKDLAGRKISVLKFTTFSSSLKIGGTGFNRQLERLEPVAYSLIIGSHQVSKPNDSGKVEFWRVNGLMGALTESIKPFEVMGQVVDVVYSDIY